MIQPGPALSSAIHHDFGEVRIVQVVEPGAAFGMRQEEVPEPAFLRAFLQFFHDRCGFPAIAGVDLFGEDALVRNDVCVDEIENVVAERFDAFGDTKVHVSSPVF